MPLIVIMLGIFGILAGGMVNVLADDLPLRRSPTLPKYPDDTKRPFIAWLGLTAFLFGKRTSPEGAKLSWRHPIAEIATAALMILTYVRVMTEMPATTDLQLFFWLVYMPIFVLITIIDIEHKLILFVVIIPTTILTLVTSITAANVYIPNLGDALIGGAVGFAVFFFIYNGGFVFLYIMNKIRGEKIDTVAFGYGDVMLGTVSGLMLGLGPLVPSLFIAVFFGAIGAIIYLVVRQIIGQKYSWFTALPYGPYIVLATIIMLLYRAEAQYLLLGYCHPAPPLVCGG